MDAIPTDVRISAFVSTLLERLVVTDSSAVVVLRLGVCGMVTYADFAIRRGAGPIALFIDLFVGVSTIGGVTTLGRTPKAETA